MPGPTSTVVWIENEQGDRLPVKVKDEGGKPLGTVFIEGIPYHVFLAERQDIVGGGVYKLDTDPDYRPTKSKSGRYALISPYST